MYTVAANFIRLQHQRHIADYDHSEHWSHSDAIEILDFSTDAFNAWLAIRAEDAAQDFLLDLLLPKRIR